MAGNHQRPDCSAPRQAKHYHHLTPSASQSSATSHDLVRPVTNEYFITPAFCSPFNGTYPSQLEITKDEDTPTCSRTAIPGAAVMETHQGATTAASPPWTTTQDRNFNYRNEPLYFPITRPWDQRVPDPQGTNPAYCDQTQTPLAVWESQVSIVEPFNNIGEVSMEPAQPQWGEPSDQNLRQGRQTCRGG